MLKEHFRKAYPRVKSDTVSISFLRIGKILFTYNFLYTKFTQRITNLKKLLNNNDFLLFITNGDYHENIYTLLDIISTP